MVFFIYIPHTSVIYISPKESPPRFVVTQFSFLYITSCGAGLYDFIGGARVDSFA